MKKDGSILLVLVFVLMTLSSCGGKVSCPEEEVEQYIDEIDLLLEEWEDNMKILGQANIFEISLYIPGLQEIKRNVSRIEHPECSEYVNNILVTSLDEVINTSLLFANLEDFEEVYADMNSQSALFLYRAARKEYEKFKKTPVESYKSVDKYSNATPDDLNLNEEFVLPDGWHNHKIEDLDLVISSRDNFFKVADGYKFAGNGFSGQVTKKWNVEFNETKFLLLEYALSEILNSWSPDINYSIESNQVIVQNKNIVYLFEFSTEGDSDFEYLRNVIAYVETPENQAFISVFTNITEEYEVFYETAEIIFGSMRSLNN